MGSESEAPVALNDALRLFTQYEEARIRLPSDDGQVCPECGEFLQAFRLGDGFCWAGTNFPYCGFVLPIRFEGPRLPNRFLRIDLIPTGDLIDKAFLEFAISFGAYSYWGGAEVTYAVTNLVLPRSDVVAPRVWPMTALRTALFGLQRAWHHVGEDPEPETAEHAQALSVLAAIRAKLEAQNFR